VNRVTGWWWVLIIVIGVVVVCAVSAVASDGRDHTGETVRASSWADDVCGTVGTWEGTLEVLRDEISHNNYGSRPSDGGSGDAVEGNVFIRAVITRAIRATNDVLQEGIKRAGTPDTSHGQAAALVLRGWAERTEIQLRAIRRSLKQDPHSVESSYTALTDASLVLQRSIAVGHQAFESLGLTDTDLGDAISGSSTCRTLTEEMS
jgi:hypothetical protein